MISKKEIEIIAGKWDRGRKWCDCNRDLVRTVYLQSEPIDKGLNLQYLGKQIGINIKELEKIGQLDVYRQMIHQEKVGKKVDFYKAKKKVEKKKAKKKGEKIESVNAGIIETYHDMAGYAGSTGKSTKKGDGKKTNVAAGRFFGK